MKQNEVFYESTKLTIMRSVKRQDTDRGAKLNAGTKAGEGRERSAPDVG